MMGDKRGEGGVPWYLLALILMVIVLIVVWLGTSGKFRQLFGITETNIKNLNESTSGLFDFSKIFGQKKDVSDKEKFAVNNNPEGYMKGLLNAGEKDKLEEYLGICIGDVKYITRFGKEVFEKLKSFCSDENEADAQRRLNEIKASDLRVLWATFKDYLSRGLIKEAIDIFDSRIKGLETNEDLIKEGQQLLDKAKSEAQGKLQDLQQLQHPECKDATKIFTKVDAWECEGNKFFEKGRNDLSAYDKAIKAYTNLVKEASGNDVLSFRGYKLIGDTYIAKTDSGLGIENKISGYNLYEDLLVSFENRYKIIGNDYFKVKEILKNVFSGPDKEFYKKNVKFSKINYYATFHAVVNQNDYVFYPSNYYIWFSYPLNDNNDKRTGDIQ